jgi:DNA segregation ATPase FtsK/SpoIIIE, S-DNA-T family
MPRRKSVYSMPKLKLKQKTIISVASIVSFILALLSVASFVSKSPYVSFWKDFLMETIGYSLVLSPFIFISIGMVLHKSRWRFAQLNVLIGLLTIMVAMTGLLAIASETAGGGLGLFIWEILILISVLGIGIVVLLDTSIGQVVETVGKSKGAFTAVGSMTGKAAGAFKRKDNFEKGLGDIKVSGIEDNRQIRGKAPAPNPKEMVAAETLVQNVAGQTRVWKYPPYSLLSDKGGAPADRGDVKKNAAIIERTLDSFGIQARVAEVNGGPAVTQYALEISQGTKIAKIASLQHDIALALATRTGTVRIEAPIPGKSLVGIEVPNHSLEVVTIKSVLASEEMKKQKSRLAATLGKDTASKPMVIDISRMPHVLVAGTTGSGKSMLMHQWVSSLIFRNSPD